ncbi:hypothetical protein FQN60_014726 [Etheostoma spectabile]|uniref:Uncharacterized protein n=1 Tax=Etheostoma spectabile TaxID=54343 RepID=A0A5J5CN72_9PERO|nr:hypothetical protein FQN60_014726 [Etheostoma spectabile]
MPKRVVYLWIFYHFFFEMCIAEDIQCTVIHDGEQTRYNVSEFNGTDCLYQWKNGTEFSLATNDARVDNQVVEKSNRTLVTNKCSELIHYTVDCLAEPTAAGMQVSRDKKSLVTTVGLLLLSRCCCWG